MNVRMKITAATAVVMLGIGGALALAGPANAEEAAPPTAPSTTEVAPSPADTEPTSDSPTSPSTPTETPSTEAPADDPASASTDQPDVSSPPTDSPDSGSSSPSSSTEEAPAAETPSSSPIEGGPSTVPAPTVEQFWAMPNGGTPENVTWPQTAANDPECGVWYQVDTYLTSERDTFVADGILTIGEDYQTQYQRGAISWRFVFGGECPPPPAAANPAATIDQTCGAANVTVTNDLGDAEQRLTASVVIYVDGNFDQALAVLGGQTGTASFTFPEDSGEHSVEVRTGPAFGDVLLAEAGGIESDCVVTPPVVVPPVVVPPVVVPPVVIVPAVPAALVAAPAPIEQLAQTGSNVEQQNYILGWSAAILLLAGLLVLGAKLAVNRNRAHLARERRMQDIESGTVNPLD